MVETRLVKLSGGEEVIAKLMTNNDGTVTLVKALIVVAERTGDPATPIRVAFAPAFPFAKDPENVTLPASSVRYSIEPNEQLAVEHLRLTSGLVLPNAK